jgi:hypothetical protein
MKYIKTYEAAISNKSVINAIANFLQRALPDNFKLKVYRGTINIDDKNIKNKIHNMGLFYILENVVSNLELHLCYRTKEGSNIDIAVKYIVDQLQNISLIKYEEHNQWSFNKSYIATFDSNDLEDIINLFNNLPSEDLNIFMTANKFNL